MNPQQMNYVQSLPTSPASTSSSSTNSSTGSIGFRPDPVGTGPLSPPTYRVTTENELRKEGVEKLIQRLRFCENENRKLLIERSRVMKDVNKRLQVHLIEVRGVREINQKLQMENDQLRKEKEELSGICCFLDDDREKSKKVAKEWQTFGRYATGVLQKEIAQYTTKLKDLEQKQQNLLKENKNLKELCIFMDQEQQTGSRTSLDSQNSSQNVSIPIFLTTAGTRDSGDGSSNGSTASNCSPDHRSLTAAGKDSFNIPSAEPGENYVRFLELRVRSLEDEVRGKIKKNQNPPPSLSHVHSTPAKIAPSYNNMFSPPQETYDSSSSSTISRQCSSSTSSLGNSQGSTLVQSPSANHLSMTADQPSTSSSPQKNDALIHAMKVLELHNQLENQQSATNHQRSNLDEHHKEIVREMCNVVLRKLEDRRPMVRPRPPVPPTHRTQSVSNL